MKHKVKVNVPVEKRGFLGMKKTVMETRVIEVDDKTFRKMKKEQKEQRRRQKNRPFSLEEMMLYDMIFTIQDVSMWSMTSVMTDVPEELLLSPITVNEPTGLLEDGRSVVVWAAPTIKTNERVNTPQNLQKTGQASYKFSNQRVHSCHAWNNCFRCFAK